MSHLTAQVEMQALLQAVLGSSAGAELDNVRLSAA
jgi:hypothetical protein